MSGQICFVITLYVIYAANAYQPPTFGCSGIRVQIIEGLDDSLKEGDVLFYTNSPVTNCPKILDVKQRNDNQTGSNVTLNIDLGSYCEENNIACIMTTCVSEEIIRGDIARTLPYHIIFEENSYTAKVKEDVKDVHVRLNKAVSLAISNCTVGAKIINGYVGIYSISMVDTAVSPFYWSAATINNSLYVNGSLDFETKNKYHLTIKASLTNNRNEKLDGTATVDVYVEVEDVDDNNPRFNVSNPPAVYSLDVKEENSSIVNTPLITEPAIFAYDPDYGINETIIYSILGQEDPGLFVINQDGSISITKVLDYEKKSKYSVMIKAAQEDKPDTATALATLRVNVKDVDDNPPKFTEKTYSCSINEHSSVGSVICTITVVDNDTTPENTNFSFHEWSDNLPVSVKKRGEMNGDIIVNNMVELDRETIGERLTFQVGTKMPSGVYSDNATVEITLIDINDNSPKFTQDPYHFNVDINATSDDVGKVHAEDADEGRNKEITYYLLPVVSSSCSMSQSSSLMFKLNSTSGEISFRQQGFCSKYELSVQACDNGTNRRCNFTSVEITLSSDGDARILTQNVSVAEESPNNTYIELIKCNAVDHDYTIYNDGHEFEIDSNTGMLKTNEVLDREKNESYNFMVNVTIGKKVLCVVNVTVKVEDINDNTPLFIGQPYHFVLSTTPKNGDFLGTVNALDGDISENGNVSYFLEQQSYKPFLIDQASGNITINHVDLITDDIIDFYVVAMDNGTPPRQNHTIVFVTGETSFNMVPISTPLTVEHIKSIQKQLERSVTDILKMDIEIGKVEEVLNKSSPYKSKIHIRTTQNTTISTQTFLSQVSAYYEDIRSLFYQSSANTGTEPRKSGIGPSEIGLIVMAAVILIGAILAIVIIHRQFSSQKKYKQLYDSLTKNSSIYESQEIAVTICEDEPECNGSIHDQDVNENDLTTTPNLAVTAVNPTYIPDSDVTIVAELNGDASDTPENENTDVKTENVGNDDDDDDHKSLNDDENVDTTSPIVYANVNDDEIRDYENTNVVNAQIEPETENDGDEETPVSKSNDLMTFDSESSDGANEQTDKENGVKTENEDIDDEPKPDYNEKQVRFHSEVLHAEENKIEPLKVKNEDSVGTDMPDAEEEDETEKADDEAENDVQDNSDMSDNGSSKDAPNVKMDSFDSAENEEGVHNSTDDTDRLEEEIIAPGMHYDENIQDEFYFGEMASTHF